MHSSLTAEIVSAAGLAAVLGSALRPVMMPGTSLPALLGEFTGLGLATVLPSLALCVVALWLGLQVLAARVSRGNANRPPDDPAGGWRVLLMFCAARR